MGPGSAWRETRGAEVGDENEQRPLIGGFLFAVCGIWGQRRGDDWEEDEWGGVNLDRRASRFWSLGWMGTWRPSS
jgi:hypothetical protein